MLLLCFTGRDRFDKLSKHSSWLKKLTQQCFYGELYLWLKDFYLLLWLWTACIVLFWILLVGFRIKLKHRRIVTSNDKFYYWTRYIQSWEPYNTPTHARTCWDMYLHPQNWINECYHWTMIYGHPWRLRTRLACNLSNSKWPKLVSIYVSLLLACITPEAILS